MKRLIVGLGNPGGKYERTRHNLGRRVADRLLAEQQAGRFPTDAIVLGSDWKEGARYYMNELGVPIHEAARREGIGPEGVLVIYDELDLALGRCQLRKGGGSAGHKGVASVMERLGGDFWRLRLGIGTPEQAKREIPSEAFVLQPFSAAEEEAVAELIEEAVQSARAWADGEPETTG
jgi:peptidyl-tRNA hydrolase, PTH1 family